MVSSKFNLPERKKRREERNKIFVDSIHKFCHPELLERTTEQQRNDMFKTMNEASKRDEGEMEIFEGITFKELQDREIEKGTPDGKMF